VGLKQKPRNLHNNSCANGNIINLQRSNKDEWESQLSCTPPPPSTHLLRDGGVKLEGNIHSRCLDSAVGKMTRPWAGCRRIHGLIHGRGKTLFLLQSV
jgi:hypothetical protein